jgi:GntR family transcriptional regulator
MGDARVPYLQVANAIRDEIRAGRLKAGDRLPTVVELSKQYGVAKMTVQKAIGELRDEGLIVSWQGRGTFVRDRADDREPQNEFDAVMRRLDGMHDEMKQLDERLTRLESQDPTGRPRSRRRAD